MARNFTTGNYLKRASPGDLGGTGTVFFRFKPNWNSADFMGVSSGHVPFSYGKGNENLTYLHFSDHNLYIGWTTSGGGEQRIIIPDTGLFVSGVWANHLFDWDDSTDLQHLYINNTLQGTSTAAFTALTAFDVFTVGAISPWPLASVVEGDLSADGHGAVFARWDRVLTTEERALVQSTGNPECVPTNLARYYKILGSASPEPDELTANSLTVIGTPTQSTHPTVGSCSDDVTPDRIESTLTFFAPTVADVVQSVSYTALGHAARLYFTIPSTPIKLIVYHSGSGEDYQAVITDSLKSAVINALFAAGYYIAGVSVGDNWGNQDAIDTYNDLHSQIDVDYAIDRTGFLSQSMGGLSGLLCLAGGTINANAWYGIYPVCDLRNIYDLGAFAGAIRTAYGIEPGGSDYNALTAGHDPILKSASEFPLIRYRFTASSSDTSVPKVDNSDDFSALIASRGIEETVVAASGNHGDPSHFNAADVVAFFNRATETFIEPQHISSTVQVFAPIVGSVITAERLESALQFFAPTLSEEFAPARIESTLVFYAPSIGSDAVKGLTITISDRLAEG